MVDLFYKGLGIGIMVAAPVGPIGLLCIQRSVTKGFKSGFLSGIGAALADACYSSLSVFGIVAISTFLLSHQMLIQFLGSLFILGLGLQTAIQFKTSSLCSSSISYWQDFSSTFALTLTNPSTLLAFLAIYASVQGANETAAYADAILFISGVFLGSLSWWGILSSSVNAMRGHLQEKNLRWINRISGMALILLGGKSLLVNLKHFFPF